MPTDSFMPVETVRLLGGRTVEVRELTWKQLLHALKQLAQRALTFVAQDGKTISIEASKIVEALSEQEELAVWIVEKSTGLTADELALLGVRDFLAIVEAVVRINLSEEVVCLGKRIAGSVRAVAAPIEPAK